MFQDNNDPLVAITICLGVRYCGTVRCIYAMLPRYYSHIETRAGKLLREPLCMASCRYPSKHGRDKY